MNSSQAPCAAMSTYKHDDDIAFHFATLWVSHKKLEAAGDELLDNLLTVSVLGN